MTLANTSIADNQTGSDCRSPVESRGHNLVGDGCLCTTTGDLVGTVSEPIDPLLGELRDNGGPTLTHALLPGSPAIDAGNPAPPGTVGTACPATAQRGVARPQGPRCDIGAFELVPTGPKTITVTKTGDTDACFFTDYCGFRCVRSLTPAELKQLRVASK